MTDPFFEGQTAVVTGAGGTLCSEIAKELARRGTKVALLGRTSATLERVAEEIAAAGGTFCFARRAQWQANHFLALVHCRRMPPMPRNCFTGIPTSLVENSQFSSVIFRTFLCSTLACSPKTKAWELRWTFFMPTMATNCVLLCPGRNGQSSPLL